VPLSRFRLHSGERFRYEYDFTADWKLDLRLERVLPFDPERALPSWMAVRIADYVGSDINRIMSDYAACRIGARCCRPCLLLAAISTVSNPT
jgi:hypothetical protein